MKFEFTTEEVNSLIAMLDLAVKAGGLQVAETGIYFVNKLKKPLPETEAVTSVNQKGGITAKEVKVK